VLGLTATPIRRDGQQPIIFMQCGPTRHTAAKPTGAPHDLAVTPWMLNSRIDLPPEGGIQDVFRHLAIDQARISSGNCACNSQRDLAAPWCDQERDDAIPWTDTQYRRFA
jgi:hypothetical protein